MNHPRLVYSLDWWNTCTKCRQWQDQGKKDDFARTIGGAFVQFGAGARVSKIRLPSDFSAARINGLQPNTSKESVRQLLSEKGLQVSVDNTRILHMESGCGAIVKSDDPSFSKTLCALIQPGCMWGGAKISATPIAAPMPSRHNARRVDCKKVHISWHKAVKIVWLTYGSGDAARKASQMFSSGTYLILGQNISASGAREALLPFCRRKLSMNQFSWTVSLTEVPAAAKQHDIFGAITHAGNKPQGVKMGNPTYETDGERDVATIRSLLTNIGPLEYWEVTLETNAKRVKATARFLDESDAQRAVLELNNTELPFHRKARLTVQSVHSAKFKVGCSTYNAVQARILTQQRPWKERNVSFRAYPSTDPLQRFRVLKIEGESAGDVAHAKTDLELILAGVIVKDGDAALWDTSLKANGKLYQEIKRLERELAVIVIRDKVKSELRLLGTEPCCDKAQARLVRLLRTQSLANSTHIIGLGPEKFFWACQGGFRNLVARLGPGKASFDIVSMPKRIIISGSWEDYDVAVAVMEGTEPVVESNAELQDNATAQECSVCWTDADTPIKTECGHVYCLECFESACTACMGDEFAILCHGDQGRCNTVIGVEELQEHLSSAVLERVFDVSFAFHVKRNPNELRYCPTPDCGYIYRTTANTRQHTCTNCLQPTCAACHEPHTGMSCVDYREFKSGNRVALLELKKKLGIKDCPKCTTPIEKTDGCNHITCGACQAHICWVCMMTFPEGDAVYRHMNKLHGRHVDILDD